MPWPPDEHVPLDSQCTGALQMLDTLVHRLDRGGGTHYMQHDDMAARARQLGLYLRGAHDLAHADAYPAAFALLRVSLEHQLLDELVFRGRTWVQVFDNVTEDVWAKWQVERAQGQRWTADIIDLTRSRAGRARVVRKGLQMEPDANGERQGISIYYFLLQQYRPMVPRPSEATKPTQGFPYEPDTIIRQTKANRDLYESYLRWTSIRESLLSNQFESTESIARIDVHYRFLSAYVHPLSNRMQDTYGRNVSWPCYDHFSSELASLYLLTFAARELRSFQNMCSLPPVVGIVDPEEFGRTVTAFERAASHLWFPGQPHHHFDEWASANYAEWVSYESGQQSQRPPPLVYYSDPLKRLIDMHHSVREMSTGLAYVSPWERQDAQFR